MQKTADKGGAVLPKEVLEEVLGAIPDTVYSMVPAEARMVFASDSVEGLTGYTPEEICSDQISWLDIVHPDDRSRYSSRIAQCLQSGEKLEIEYRIVRKDGSDCDVLDAAIPSKYDEETPVCLNGLVRDITTLKQTRRELDKSQMLQSIGKLSAGIAHEINTPIQFLGDNMRFLKDSFDELSELIRAYWKLRDEANDSTTGEIRAMEEQMDIEFLMKEIPQAISQSIDGIKLVSKIVSAMRDFSHIDDTRKVAADINKAINSTIIILRNKIKHIADVEKDLDESLPQIVCCVDDMHQVFLNLLINASHSIEDVIESGASSRGRITVKTSHDADDVIISISDTGTGIPAEIRRKIFEPFFTTKSKNRKGTGQGLAIVRSIVEGKHSGRIELDSEVGVGTTFTIRLPKDSKSEQ